MKGTRALFTLITETSQYYGSKRARQDTGQVVELTPGLWCGLVATDATTVTFVGHCGTASIVYDAGSVFYFWTDALISVDKAVVLNYVGDHPRFNVGTIPAGLSASSGVGIGLVKS